MKQILRKVILLLTTCLLLSADFALAEPALNVQSYTLVNRKRLSRTVYEYTYKAQVENLGTDALNVTAQLSIDSGHVTIIDGSVDFGDVLTGSTVVGIDTFTFQQDRLYPIDSDAISWNFSYQTPAMPQVALTATPPIINPGEQATLTWNATGADSAIIDQGIGSVALSGSAIVSPQTTLTYTITATGAGGPVQAQATIAVREMTTRTRYEYDDGGRVVRIIREAVLP